MNQFTDLVIVTFLQDQTEGDIFLRSRHNGWPLHITLAPWFGITNQSILDGELRSLASRLRPFEVKVGPEQLFGENNDIGVNLIEDQTLLKQIHDKLSSIITTNGDYLINRWTGANFKAHITRHDSSVQEYRQGDKLTINHLYVVKMLDDGHCQFLKKYPFGDNDVTAA